MQRQNVIRAIQRYKEYDLFMLPRTRTKDIEKVVMRDVQKTLAKALKTGRDFSVVVGIE